MNFDRNHFWQKKPLRYKGPFETLYTTGFVFPESVHARISELVSQCIEKSSDTSFVGFNWLNETKSFSIKTHKCLDELTELESVFLEHLGIESLKEMGIAGIQFPMDIRVVHPEAPEGYLERVDATDKLHCDPWRGEPGDVINALYYVHVPKLSPKMLAFDVDRNQIRNMEKFKGPEADAWKLMGDCAEIKYEAKERQLLLFDAYVPHATDRIGATEVRVSINFSFRRLDPYAVIDERWDRARQNWSKYWRIPSKPTRFFHFRYGEELGKLSAGDAQVLQKRIDYVVSLEGKNEVY